MAIFEVVPNSFRVAAMACVSFFSLTRIMVSRVTLLRTKRRTTTGTGTRYGIGGCWRERRGIYPIQAGTLVDDQGVRQHHSGWCRSNERVEHPYTVGEDHDNYTTLQYYTTNPPLRSHRTIVTKTTKKHDSLIQVVYNWYIH
ncbi:expressed unknown protein [Seminavis robusta]|uniref:Uncharacterized protein n=1 Tax=Seminavis robusta TaxID=568900 RepID=A0A9N8DJ74_9STRA|nr:expressed unknown protein [Seminavis robusta]|eukprot:Sro173_g076340.1 n/a (142) ;mRNA; r:53511-53936